MSPRCKGSLLRSLEFPFTTFPSKQPQQKKWDLSAAKKGSLLTPRSCWKKFDPIFDCILLLRLVPCTLFLVPSALFLFLVFCALSLVPCLPAGRQVSCS